jgi:hypothetical protein
LKPKYQVALEMYDKMTRSLSLKRPDCKEILNQKDLWALTDSELEINNETKETIISKSNDENNIIYFILKTKLDI